MGDRRLDVLVLDDDVLVARALTRYLKTFHDVRTVTTVDDALAELSRREPDAIICDYELASTTSADFLRTISAAYPRLWRVLNSGSQPEQWYALLEKKLIDVAVTKPAPPEKLLAALLKR